MSHSDRRSFLKGSAVLAAATVLPEWLADSACAAGPPPPSARLRVGAIGVGGRGLAIARDARAHGDILAVCDADRARVDKANTQLADGKAETYEDYRKLLERKDIDVVTIGSPDHWHTKMCMDALRAGKDVYCEKPLTLTIDEGKKLCQAVTETKRVLQVGTQQRSEMKNMFLTAVAMVREGRIGRVKRVTCCIGSAPKGGPFTTGAPPEGFNWDLWLGPAPETEYIRERGHYTFRWWYEYSGGKMTDWGAHHVDIAQWAIGMERSGPTSLDPLMVKHPVVFRDGWPTAKDSYNTATEFQVRCNFPNGVEMLVQSAGENGITFEGEKGTLFVSRSKLTGEAVDALATEPISEAVYVALRKGKKLGSHMANFAECVRDRGLPVSDVYTHHRALSTCHLANIAMRLGRRLTWDAATESITGDREASRFLAREERKGYQVEG